MEQYWPSAIVGDEGKRPFLVQTNHGCDSEVEAELVIHHLRKIYDFVYASWVETYNGAEVTTGSFHCHVNTLGFVEGSKKR